MLRCAQHDNTAQHDTTPRQHLVNSADLLATHQYQYDGSHRNRNECGLCSMAMLLTHAARATGNPQFRLPAAKLGRFLDRIPFRYPRFPAWFPGPGGATHPLAALWGLRAYGRKVEQSGIVFPWRPVLRTRQTAADLETALAAEQPTLIYGVGASGIPHVVVPIARQQDDWLILDPGTPSAGNPVLWSDPQLQSWWVNYSILYPRGTLVTLLHESDRKETR